MQRKLYALFLAGVMSLGVLAGCGSSSGSTETSSGTETDTVNTDGQDAAADESEGEDQAKEELVFVNYRDIDRKSVV